jgi:hypothetical protein
MTGGREVELKRLLIGEGAADRLLAALGHPVRVTHWQRNHVLDTEDRRLAAAELALRVREERSGEAPAVCSLTAKGPARRLGASTVARAEVEVGVTGEVAGALLAGDREPVATLRAATVDPRDRALLDALASAAAGRPIRPLGAFENTRRVVPVTLPDGLPLVVELDHTRFPGGRADDEVEIELAGEALVPAAEAWLEARARAAGVATAPASPKLARFFAALGAPPGRPTP